MFIDACYPCVWMCLASLPTVCDASRRSCRPRWCALTLGSWCKQFMRQQPVPWHPPQHGSKDCPGTQYGTCNGVGTCNYDFGTCDCPAGGVGNSRVSCVCFRLFALLLLTIIYMYYMYCVLLFCCGVSLLYVVSMFVTSAQRSTCGTKCVLL